MSERSRKQYAAFMRLREAVRLELLERAYLAPSAPARAAGDDDSTGETEAA